MFFSTLPLYIVHVLEILLVITSSPATLGSHTIMWHRNRMGEIFRVPPKHTLEICLLTWADVIHATWGQSRIQGKIENIYPWHLTSKPDHLFSHPGFFKQQRGCPNMLVTYVQGTVLYGKTLNYVQSYCFLEGVEPWVLTSVRTHLATLKGFAHREKKFTYKQQTNK